MKILIFILLIFAVSLMIFPIFLISEPYQQGLIPIWCFMGLSIMVTSLLSCGIVLIIITIKNIINAGKV